MRTLLSRHEIRSKVDEVVGLIENFVAEPEPAAPLPGLQRRWWALTDRLDEAARRQLVKDRRDGVKLSVLATKYGISLSSVQRLLRRFENDM